MGRAAIALCGLLAATIMLGGLIWFAGIGLVTVIESIL